MAKWKPLVITEAGYQLSALTIAGKTVKFTRAVTSSIDLSNKSKDDLSALSKLDGIVQELDIGRQSVQDDHTIILPIPILNSVNGNNISEDYELYSVGIYAKPVDPKDGEEQLFGVVVASVPDLIPAFDGKVAQGIKMKIKVRVGKTDKIDISFSSDGAVNEDDLNVILKDYVLSSDLKSYVLKTELKDYALKVDLNGYATEKYVNDKLKDIPKPDMSEYYTKAEVDQIIINTKQAVIDQIQPLIDAEMKKRNVPSIFWDGTQDEFNAIQTKDSNGTYMIHKK